MSGSRYFRLPRRSPCQIEKSQRHKFLPESQTGDWNHYKYDPDLSSFTTLREAVGETGQEKCLKGTFGIFTFEAERSAIFLIGATEHVIRDNTKILTWETSGCHGASWWNVTVLQLCYTTCLFVVLDVDNRALRQDFVGHDLKEIGVAWLRHCITIVQAVCIICKPV